MCSSCAVAGNKKAEPPVWVPPLNKFSLLPTLALPKSGVRVEVDDFLSACAQAPLLQYSVFDSAMVRPVVSVRLSERGPFFCITARQGLVCQAVTGHGAWRMCLNLPLPACCRGKSPDSETDTREIPCVDRNACRAVLACSNAASLVVPSTGRAAIVPYCRVRPPAGIAAGNRLP